jgi:hypothetical protein
MYPRSRSLKADDVAIVEILLVCCTSMFIRSAAGEILDIAMRICVALVMLE